MRFSFGLCPFLLSFLVLTGLCAQTGPPDKNQQEASAKELIAEGKALEQQGKLVEAKDKYAESLGVVSTSEALDAIRRINDQMKQQVESLLAEAHRLFDAGKFSESAQQLQQAVELFPQGPVLHSDLALCYAKQGDRANAALEFDSALAGLTNEKDREELLEQLSSVLMGTAAPDFADENKKSLASFNDSYLQEDREANDAKAPGGGLCEQTKTLEESFPTNAAVVFNSAKCAEEDGRFEGAARQLADYNKLAPEALDNSDADLFRASALSLASLTGDSGQQIRQHYATAASFLDYRHYDRAVSEYEAAASISPDYAQTQWQLGLLYEAFGDVTKAHDYFSKFQQLEPDATRKADADPHLSTLDARRDLYDANVGDAQDILTGLLQSSMGLENEGAKHKRRLTYRQWRWASGRYKDTTSATEKLPVPYVVRELNRARQDLDSSTDLFPLGCEANELLALISLQWNDWPEAYRNFDAVASQGFPVSFYAQVNSARDSKAVRATKVEISSGSIRLVYLSSYDPKRQVSEAPNASAGEDDLGNLVVSAAAPPDAHAEALTIRATDLKGIETENNFVVLKLENDQLYLAPLNLLSDIPFQGSASRAFGNEYTRLFVRYLGYEDARLGKEGMTTGEKFELGFEIARIGMSAARMGMGGGGPVAFSSAMRRARRARRAVRLAHALSVYREYRSIKRDVHVVHMADAVLRLAENLDESVTTLERTSGDQRRAIEGMEFKIIPTQQWQLKYRERF
jgi:tetratricopeptide (TPR) repeat protein